MRTTNEDKVSVYEIVTLRILDLMEEGTIPWNQPYCGGPSSMPKNLVSGKEYRGINRWLLYGLFGSPYYLTLKQCLELGARVKREEFNKPSIVTYWNMVDSVDKETGKKVRKAFLRYYRVYNVDQCEGLKHSRLVVSDNGNVELLKPSAIVKGMPNCPMIRQDSPNSAYYVPSTDRVHIGTVKQFVSSEAYHATLFHELAHSTGHASRLDRDLKPSVDKEKYSREELIAEFSSAFLCEISGISKPVIKNSAAYIQHWKSFLSEDVGAVIHAASRAEKACDYILNKKPTSNGDID
jgi:antirestriction protein ArdC